MKALFLFGHANHARHAGFTRPDGRHRQDASLQRWIVGEPPDALRGRRFSHIIVTESVTRGEFKGKVRDDLHAAIREAQFGLTEAPQIWIDL